MMHFTHLLILLVVILCKVDLCWTLWWSGNGFSDCVTTVRRASCKGHTKLTDYRTIDGTCNNPEKKLQGAARTPLKRLLPARYYDWYHRGTPLGYPTVYFPRVASAHQVSQAFFKPTTASTGNKNMLSNMFMAFGQFLDHDLDHTRNSGGCANPRCWRFSLKDFKYPCFPIVNKYSAQITCTKFTRSQATCESKRFVRQQPNMLSSYIDASQIYSNDVRKSKLLRKMKNTGLLKLRSNGLPLLDKQATEPCKHRGGCFLLGDGRADEHIGLASIQILFVREHNRIAKKLRQINKGWNGEKIYQETRKIVYAVLQHITYNEYLPLITDLQPYKGYNHTVDASVSNVFSTAAFRFAHSQIQNMWPQLDIKTYNPILPDVPLRETFKNNSLILKFGIEPTMAGLIGNQSMAVDHRFSFASIRKLFIEPGKRGLEDLAALDIQRGRDHGLPGYRWWRKFCKLGSSYKFSRLWREITSAHVRNKLKKLFRGMLGLVDVFVAGLLEKHVHNKIVGPTFLCLLTEQFERLRDGDRYWFENPGVFSHQQVVEIKKHSLAKIMCDNLKGAVSIQKNVMKVFNGDNRRVACNSIPGLNLQKWKQSP